MPRVPPRLTANARDLRKHATISERIMWRLLSAYRPRFTRQHVVGPYIVDIACRRARIAVEFDGRQHLDAVDYDAARTAYLESLGWRIIRFWNNEISDNPEGVAAAILVAVAEKREGTHPQPLPACREGRRRRRQDPSS
jgi:very-short-patch-repair endonuclease